MKKLILTLVMCFAAFAAMAQCPVVNLVQNAKWKFTFSQCFLDTTTHTYVTPAQVAYFDGNQNLTTIPFAQLADSIGVSGPNGNQWNIQYYDGGNFGSSTNFNFNGFNGVFYIYDVNGDTLFSVNVNTREIKGYGTFTGNIGNFDTLTANTFTDPTTYPDSSVLFVGSDGKPTTDSTRFRYFVQSNQPRFIIGNNYQASGYTAQAITFRQEGALGGQVGIQGAGKSPDLVFTRSNGTFTSPTQVTSAASTYLKQSTILVRGTSSFTTPHTERFWLTQNATDAGAMFKYSWGQFDSTIGSPLIRYSVEDDGSFNIYGRSGGATSNTIDRSGFDFKVFGTAAIAQTPASTSGTDSILVKASTGQVKTMPFEEGTYLPTDSGQTNFNTLTLNTANYSRVGKTVTVFGTFNMDPLTAGGTLTFFYLSLPIATNLPLNSSGGTFNGRSGERGTIYSDGNSSNRVLVSFLATTTSSTIASYSYSYTIQ